MLFRSLEREILEEVKRVTTEATQAVRDRAATASSSAAPIAAPAQAAGGAQSKKSKKRVKIATRATKATASQPPAASAADNQGTRVARRARGGGILRYFAPALMWFLFSIAEGAPAAGTRGDETTWIDVSIEPHITLRTYQFEVCVGARGHNDWVWSNSTVEVDKDNQTTTIDPGWNAWTAGMAVNSST